MDDTKELELRLRRWATGDYLHLWSDASSSSSVSSVPNTRAATEKGKAHRVLQAAREGNYSKAINHLSANPPCDLSTDIMRILSDLHPSASPVTLDLSEFEFSSEDLRPVHLLEMLRNCSTRGGVVLVEALQQFCKAAAGGKFPLWFAPYFTSARLIPISKPSGGVRPIAVGLSLRSLVGKLVLKKTSVAIVSYLSPLQLGVGIAGATDKAAW